MSLTKSFNETNESFVNPLIGYAPMPFHPAVDSEKVSLVYVQVLFSEIEPEEGVFDWESFENKNRFEYLRRAGIHVVLRFICDLPTNEAHRDIPDWLYEKTADGTDYQTSFGKGYSPDYNNEIFIDAHRKAVEALGERYANDSLISYIELGSLGHWGEWHVKFSSGIAKIPKKSVRLEYVEPWVRAFPNTKILMRRPFAEAKQYGFGVYNDMAGSYAETKEWLDWIEKGGVYEQTDERDAIVPIKDIWNNAPVGGELNSLLPMGNMLRACLHDTVKMIRESHTSFLGPKIAEEEYEDGYNELQKNLGYRLLVTDMKLSHGKVYLTWKNTGSAPFYFDWKVKLIVESRDENPVKVFDVDINLSEVYNKTVVTKTKIGKDVAEKITDGEYILSLGIIDPMTSLPSVRLASDTEFVNGKNILYYKKELT